MHVLLQGCKRNDRDSQRLLYQHYYSYALSICIRYSRNVAEAKEVVNDGFMKVFSKIDQYNSQTSFLGWLRRIMINTAIDHYRKEVKHYNQVSIDADAIKNEVDSASLRRGLLFAPGWVFLNASAKSPINTALNWPDFVLLKKRWTTPHSKACDKTRRRNL